MNDTERAAALAARQRVTTTERLWSDIVGDVEASSALDRVASYEFSNGRKFYNQPFYKDLP